MKTMNNAVVNKKTHGQFWTLIRLLPEYDPEYKQEIKEALVDKFSGGKTTSLSELLAKYPDRYREMIYQLKIDTFQSSRSKRSYDPDGDKWRKRAIAACFAYLRRQDIDANINYVIAVICRASGYEKFNKIPTTRLQEVYNMFTKRLKTATSFEIERGIEVDYIMNEINKIIKQ